MSALRVCCLFVDAEEICNSNIVNGTLSSTRPQVCELRLRSYDNCSSIRN